MILPVVLCAALAGTAFGNPNANRVMDRILSTMAAEVATSGLASQRVYSFELKVGANSLTNRDLKAKFVKGSLEGFDRIRREGDCSLTSGRYETIMKCHVSLGSLHFSMDADVKGDTLSGDPHRISISSALTPDNLLLVELKGEKPYNFETSKLSMNPVLMKTQLANGKLDLNSERLNKFANLVNRNLALQLESILAGPFTTALRDVASRFQMP